MTLEMELQISDLFDLGQWTLDYLFRYLYMIWSSQKWRLGCKPFFQVVLRWKSDLSAAAVCGEHKLNPY